MEWRNTKATKEMLEKIMIPGKTIVVFDCETTGLKEDDEIIQFSAIKYQVGADLRLSETSVLNHYIKPTIGVPKRVTEITGITDEMLADKLTAEELAPAIFRFMSSCDAWSGYNVKFDVGMLNNMFKRLIENFVPNWGVPVVDVLELARDVIPKGDIDNFKLSTVAAYLLGDTKYSFHNSLDDVRATAEIMKEAGMKILSAEINENKVPVHLEKANLFINPRAKSQQRIRVLISTGELGDIYYDLVKKVWGHKSNPKAKKLFEMIDLADLERQMLEKYGYRYGNNSMDEIGKAWMKYAREKAKA